MSKVDEFTARQLHQILMNNLQKLDKGDVSPTRAHAIARLGSTIFQGVSVRMKVHDALANDKAVPDDIAAFAA